MVNFGVNQFLDMIRRTPASQQPQAGVGIDRRNATDERTQAGQSAGHRSDLWAREYGPPGLRFGMGAGLVGPEPPAQPDSDALLGDRGALARPTDTAAGLRLPWQPPIAQPQPAQAIPRPLLPPGLELPPGLGRGTPPGLGLVPSNLRAMIPRRLPFGVPRNPRGAGQII